MCWVSAHIIPSQQWMKEAESNLSGSNHLGQAVSLKSYAEHYPIYQLDRQ